MNAREIVNKHGKWIALGALVLAVVAYFLLSGGSGPHPKQNPSFGFYVDEETGEETVHSVEEVPPLTGKSGKPSVVRAMKLTCDGGKTVVVGYYMKYPADVKSQLAGMTDTDARRPVLLEQGLFVRAPQAGSAWVRAQTEAGEKVTQVNPCGSGKPEVVHPEK